MAFLEPLPQRLLAKPIVNLFKSPDLIKDLVGELFIFFSCFYIGFGFDWLVCLLVSRIMAQVSANMVIFCLDHKNQIPVEFDNAIPTQPLIWNPFLRDPPTDALPPPTNTLPPLAENQSKRARVNIKGSIMIRGMLLSNPSAIRVQRRLSNRCWTFPVLILWPKSWLWWTTVSSLMSLCCVV